LATVSKVEDDCAFIKIGEIYCTLKAPEVDLGYIDDVRHYLNEGDIINVLVTSKDNNKLSVSRKALLKTPFELFTENYKVGQNVECTFKQKIDVGLIFDIDGNIRGLLNKREYDSDTEDNLEESLIEGDKLGLVIVQISSKRKRVSLSRKQF
jgi:small subunit ribosomal protein S1